MTKEEEEIIERRTVRLCMTKMIARMETLEGKDKMWSYPTILAFCKKTLEHPCEILANCPRNANVI